MLSLLERGCPQTYAEFIETVDQIVLCGGAQISNDEPYAGGSAFTLWGALCLNPGMPRTLHMLVETLAHEAAHSLLFGIQFSGALVLNPDEERFASPLRIDPRPMDGIYHATFVSARMHYAMRELLESGLVPQAAEASVREAAILDLRHFFDGLETVKKFGRMTPTGRAVMEGAEAYMAAQAA